MKKLFLAAIAAIGISSAASAQFEIGINFTPNSSHMLHKKHSTSDYVKEKKPFTFGFNVGATVTYNFSDAFSIVSGVNYVAAGQKNKIETTTPIINTVSTVESQTKLSYVRVPILFQFNNVPGGLYARIGPNLDFLTGSKTEIGSSTIEHEDAFKSFTLGLTGEIGKAFEISNNLKFIAGLQLTTTLINPVNKDNGYYDDHNTTNFHVGINLGLNYSFGK